MARQYHVAAACVALECSAKWLDNLLSRREIPGISRERQGVARRLSADSLLRLAVIRILIGDLATSATEAIELADRLCADGTGQCTLPSGLFLKLDLERIRRDLDHRLLHADVTPPPRRGRPPNRKLWP